jgi:serine/threonine protein kinase
MTDNDRAANAAYNLAGLSLPEGWHVESLLERSDSSTGGNFSVGYLVRHDDGREAYLKALDYSRAFSSSNPPKVLLALTQAFEFERNILQTCKASHLDRIVVTITDGTIQVPGNFKYEHVSYLIFELATGDIRNRLDLDRSFELGIRLRTLHQVAIGLEQLHKVDIAHQDLKPSNVLLFETAGAKLADLGRASQRNTPAPHDILPFAGDPSYAPPETLYGHLQHDWVQRRIGCDLYHLGSLAYFFFTQVGMTAAIHLYLDAAHHHTNWGMGFHSVLPHVRDAFDRAMDAFHMRVKAIQPKLADELNGLVRSLCEPDPKIRGDAFSIQHGTNRLSLQRFISRFDLLARRTELNLW